MKLIETQTQEKRNVVHTVRTTKTKAKWMKQHNVSPVTLFNLALDELMAEEVERTEIEAAV